MGLRSLAGVVQEQRFVQHAKRKSSPAVAFAFAFELSSVRSGVW